MVDDDPAAEALRWAKAAAARRGGRPRPGRGSAAGRPARPVRADDAQWSGARADERDPEPLGAQIDRLVDDAGWRATMTVARLMGAWDALVGPDVAAHCRPVKLDAGVLWLVAESTAWATQLRLLGRPMIERLAADLGPGVVTRVVVHGPAAPSWRHGRRRVTGARGPGDTYG